MVIVVGQFPPPSCQIASNLSCQYHSLTMCFLIPRHSLQRQLFEHQLLGIGSCTAPWLSIQAAQASGPAELWRGAAATDPAAVACGVTPCHGPKCGHAGEVQSGSLGEGCGPSDVSFCNLDPSVELSRNLQIDPYCFLEKLDIWRILILFPPGLGRLHCFSGLCR